MLRHRTFLAAIAAAVALTAALPPATADTAAAREEDPDAIAAARLKEFGQGYVSHIDRDRRLIYISALDKQNLDDTVALLADYTDAQRKTLFKQPLLWYVTVILPTVEHYRKLAPRTTAVGFYHPAKRTLISIDRGRTLLHEYTHALHHADQAAAGQVHPIWVTEGLATLFEAAEITPEGLNPVVDNRLGAIQRAIHTGSCPPLKWLLGCNAELFMKDPSLTYAQARYVMFYLHQQGQLEAWYAAFKQSFPRNATGQAALESILGQAIEGLDLRWKQWTAKVAVPAGLRQDYRGRLGIQMNDDSRGVKIISMLPQGAAAQAGRLRVGDVITAYSERPVRKPAELAAAIRATGELKTVTIQILRNNEPLTILQPLGTAGGAGSPPAGSVH
ncbi:MAG: PDZ domain-containing protein [Planctomycetaceae bacterium]|nr:PDZ domain-containing protein [Planctomycetaceae bacterium]